MRQRGSQRARHINGRLPLLPRGGTFGLLGSRHVELNEAANDDKAEATRASNRLYMRASDEHSTQADHEHMRASDRVQLKQNV